MGRRQINERRVKLKCQRYSEREEASAPGRDRRDPRTCEPRVFKEETNLKSHSESAALTTQEATKASCFWGKLNKLKDPEEKSRWQRVWTPDPAES